MKELEFKIKIEHDDFKVVAVDIDGGQFELDQSSLIIQGLKDAIKYVEEWIEQERSEFLEDNL